MRFELKIEGLSHETKAASAYISLPVAERMILVELVKAEPVRSGGPATDAGMLCFQSPHAAPDLVEAIVGAPARR